jgi:hypothetical protein
MTDINMIPAYLAHIAVNGGTKSIRHTSRCYEG